MKVVALVSILGLLLASLQALAEPTGAQNERDRIRALEQHVAQLAAELASLKSASPALRSRPSRASAGSRLALLGYTQPLAAAAMGVPIFGTRVTNPSGGNITSAQMIDPYVPVDGTMNVTGGLAVSVAGSFGGDVSLSGGNRTISSTAGRLSIDGTTSTRMLANGAIRVEANTSRVTVTPAATFGLQVSSSGSKVTCDATNVASLFYESGGAGATDELYMCLKAAADTYSWILIADGEP